MNEMFKGPDGKISMMRVSTFIVVLSIMGVFVAHNIVAMISGATFISIGASEAALIAAAMGVKAYQALLENKCKKESASRSYDSSDVSTPRGSVEDAEKADKVS